MSCVKLTLYFGLSTNKPLNGQLIIWTAIRNNVRLKSDIRQSFLSLDVVALPIYVRSQITGRAWPSTHRMHSFRKASPQISAGGFCSVEI